MNNPTNPQEIKSAWEAVLKVHYSLVEKGMDTDGWYSNERNGQWLPLQGDDIKLYDFRNNNTEVRPKSLGNNNPQGNVHQSGAAAYVKTVYGTVNFGMAISMDDAQSILDLMDDFSDHNCATLKSRIAELETELNGANRKVSFYRGEVGRIRDFVFDESNETGLPCQSIFEAIDDKIKALQAENQKYREALERLLKLNTDIDNFDMGAIDQAEKALSAEDDKTQL